MGQKEKKGRKKERKENAELLPGMILVYLLFSCFLGIKRKRISYTSKPELLDRHIDNSHDNIIIEPESPVSGWHAFFFWYRWFKVRSYNPCGNFVV